MTCELLGAPHGPLLIVQRNTLEPTESPVTPEVGLFTFAKAPVPLTNDQVPTAGAAATFAASVVPVLGKHSDWFGPALAAAWAGLYELITTSSVVMPHVR